MWKLQQFSLMHFWQKFREINGWFHEIFLWWERNYGSLLPWFFAKIPSNQRFTKELYFKLVWRKKNCVAVNFSFLTLWLWKNVKFSLTEKKIRQINFLNSNCISIVRTFLSRNFCKKVWQRNSAFSFLWTHSLKKIRQIYSSL